METVFRFVKKSDLLEYVDKDQLLVRYGGTVLRQEHKIEYSSLLNNFYRTPMSINLSPKRMRKQSKCSLAFSDKCLHICLLGFFQWATKMTLTTTWGRRRERHEAPPPVFLHYYL